MPGRSPSFGRSTAFTQVQLSEATGLSQAQISKIERGVIRPTSTTLAKIAEALESDVRLVERVAASRVETLPW